MKDITKNSIFCIVYFNITNGQSWRKKVKRLIYWNGESTCVHENMACRTFICYFPWFIPNRNDVILELCSWIPMAWLLDFIVAKVALHFRATRIIYASHHALSLQPAELALAPTARQALGWPVHSYSDHWCRLRFCSWPCPIHIVQICNLAPCCNVALPSTHTSPSCSRHGCREDGAIAVGSPTPSDGPSQMSSSGYFFRRGCLS